MDNFTDKSSEAIKASMEKAEEIGNSQGKLHRKTACARHG